MLIHIRPIVQLSYLPMVLSAYRPLSKKEWVEDGIPPALDPSRGRALPQNAGGSSITRDNCRPTVVPSGVAPIDDLHLAAGSTAKGEAPLQFGAHQERDHDQITPPRCHLRQRDSRKCPLV